MASNIFPNEFKKYDFNEYLKVILRLNDFDSGTWLQYKMETRQCDNCKKTWLTSVCRHTSRVTNVL